MHYYGSFRSVKISFSEKGGARRGVVGGELRISPDEFGESDRTRSMSGVHRG